jgi:hypothetical protein
LIARVRGYGEALRRSEAVLHKLAAGPTPTNLAPAERTLWQKYVAFVRSAATRAATMC